MFLAPTGRHVRAREGMAYGREGTRSFPGTSHTPESSSFSKSCLDCHGDPQKVGVHFFTASPAFSTSHCLLSVCH